MKSAKNFFFVLSFVLFIVSQGFASTYNILDFGAIGDGESVNTDAINKAVKKCNRGGGGTVLIPSGTFVTGTVVLLSNVNLHLESGAVLSGSKDTTDYLLMNDVLFSEGYNRYGVVYAMKATHISITGMGEINGNGTYFMNGLDKPHMGGSDYDRKFIRQGDEFMKVGSIFEDGPVSYSFRPGLLVTLEQCENIRICDVNMKDSPEWTIRIGDCDDVEIRGISILNNQLVPNSDGIHITTSRNVRISDCHIFAGDDAIIVTGFGDSPTPNDLLAGKGVEPLTIGNKTGVAENITVTNCVLSSRSACIRVGHGHHPIRNLIFSNLVMYESNRGIGIFARDDSRIENVLFSNIIINNRLHSGHWWGKGEPIHISALSNSNNVNPGIITNIRFRDVIATSETGILIYGTESSVLEDIRFDNVKLTINKGKYTESYGGNFDLRPAFPLKYAIFEHDISGIFAQHVKGLSIHDFSLLWGYELPSFFTYAIECEEVYDLSIAGFSGTSNPNAKVDQDIKMKDSSFRKE